MDQPGKVANPARGQLKGEDEYFHVSTFAPDNFVSRDGFGRPIPHQLVNSPYSGLIWCILTGFLPISAAATSIGGLLPVD